MEDCSNYRNISLLWNNSKIIEKLFHRQLYRFPEFKDLLHKNQFGVRNFHSTNHALIAITEKIRRAIDNGEITWGMLVKIARASALCSDKFCYKKITPSTSFSYITLVSQNLKCYNQWQKLWEKPLFGQFCVSLPFPLLTMLRINEQNLRQAMLSVRNIV